jgi:hypothetical protein
MDNLFPASLKNLKITCKKKKQLIALKLSENHHLIRLYLFVPLLAHNNLVIQSLYNTDVVSGLSIRGL